MCTCILHIRLNFIKSYFCLYISQTSVPWSQQISRTIVNRNLLHAAWNLPTIFADRKQPDERERTATSRRDSRCSSRSWYLLKDGVTVSPARTAPQWSTTDSQGVFFTLTDGLFPGKHLRRKNDTNAKNVCYFFSAKARDSVD